jgi:hypothetical protein
MEASGPIRGQQLTAIVVGASAARRWPNGRSPTCQRAQHPLDGMAKCVTGASEIIDNITGMARNAPAKKSNSTST